MRKKADGEPKRTPMYWTWGEPMDYKDPQTIKTINDRRNEAINRITCDRPWRDDERQTMADLFKNKPAISMREVAERLNYRFGGEFWDDGYVGTWDGKPGLFGQPDELLGKRTLESIRYEYLTFKHSYDKGQVPKVKRRPTENKTKALAESKKRKLEEISDDEANDGANGETKARKTKVDGETTTEPPTTLKSQFDAPTRIIIKRCVQDQINAKRSKYEAKDKVSKRAATLNYQDIMRCTNAELRRDKSEAEKKKFRNIKHTAIKEEVHTFQRQYRDPNIDVSSDLKMEDAPEKQQPTDGAATPTTPEPNEQLLRLAGYSPHASVLLRNTPSGPASPPPQIPPSTQASIPPQTFPSVAPNPPSPAIDRSISFHHEERCILNDLNDEDPYFYDRMTAFTDALNKRRRAEAPELKQRNRTTSEVRVHWEYYSGCYQAGIVPGPAFDGLIPSEEGRVEPCKREKGRTPQVSPAESPVDTET
jgi:hypothetical protein